MTEDDQEELHGRLRVGLVSTDPLRILGFQTIFEANPSVELICGNIPEIVRDTTIHLVLLCMTPNEALFDLISTFKRFRPDMRLIIMSEPQELKINRRIISSGARGILPDSANVQEIIQAIQTVADGSMWAPRRVLASLLDGPQQVAAQSKEIIALTVRERDVLVRLINGASNREIGTELKIEERTVKAHIAKLMRKVGVNNRTALTMYAINHKLIEQQYSIHPTK